MPKSGKTIFLAHKLPAFQAIFLLLFFSIFLAACAHGPTRENDTPLDYLNGKNYHSQTVDGLIPVSITRHAAIYEVSGTLVIQNGLPLPDPLKFQVLVLSRANKEVARTMSDMNGAFIFKAALTNDDYVVSLDSKSYSLYQTVKVSQYKTQKLELTARLITP